MQSEDPKPPPKQKYGVLKYWAMAVALVGVMLAMQLWWAAGIVAVASMVIALAERPARKNSK